LPDEIALDPLQWAGFAYFATIVTMLKLGRRVWLAGAKILQALKRWRWHS